MRAGQSAAVHGAELASASVADAMRCPSAWRGSAARRRGHAALPSCPVRPIPRGVRLPTSDHIHPQPASAQELARTRTASWEIWGSIHRADRGADSSAKGSPGAGHALTLGGGCACPSRLKSSCCTCSCHSGRSRETAPVRSSPGMLGGSFVWRMEGLAALVPIQMRAIQAGSINALSCSRRSGTGAGSGQAFASRLIKQNPGTC